jgi:hypothetical protein
VIVDSEPAAAIVVAIALVATMLPAYRAELELARALRQE